MFAICIYSIELMRLREDDLIYNYVCLIFPITTFRRVGDFVVAGLKMQFESPSQDLRLTVDERLKLLYPMVNIICAHHCWQI